VTMSKIFVLHENAQWTAPLEAELKCCGLPHELWFLDAGALDLSAPPPNGVFYSRMSASSHTRGNRYSPEYTLAVLRWLESYGRVVLNGSAALELEISKSAQYASLRVAGIRTPRTVAAFGKASIEEAAAAMSYPLITKHNRGGKGLGVAKFDDLASLQTHMAGGGYEAPIDGITLVQAYIHSPERFITRCEFVGGKFMYAVRVDTTSGFELCPAEACEPSASFCPAVGAPLEQFHILPDFGTTGSEKRLVADYEAFLADAGISIAGIEFIRDAHGQTYTYDINTNTNYNPRAEERAGHNGMRTIADYLGRVLQSQSHGGVELKVAS
jgi:hypothetical protein